MREPHPFGLMGRSPLSAILRRLLPSSSFGHSSKMRPESVRTIPVVQFDSYPAEILLFEAADIVLTDDGEAAEILSQQIGDDRN
jgi:hypothetical protein